MKLAILHAKNFLGLKFLISSTVLFASFAAQAQLTSTYIDFGRVGWDSRTTRSVYFNNMTSQVITNLNASVSGQGFTLMSNSCFTPLRQGQSCTLTIQFWGNQPGNAAGNLVVYTNANSSSASLSAFVNPHPMMLPSENEEQ